MARIVFATAALLYASFAHAADAGGLVGAWRLVSFEDRSADGKVERPYGEQPAGQLIYDRSGAMSIQVMKRPHPHVASGDDEKVTDAEKVALYDAYVAYFGTWRTDAKRGIVVHAVEGDLFDTYVGNDQARPYVLDGDTLTLKPEWDADGVHWVGIRKFERIR